MESIDVFSQHELDLALQAKSAAIRVIVCHGHSLYQVENSQEIVARDAARIEVSGDSFVTAEGQSEIVARGSAHVLARGEARVEALT